MQEGPHSRTSRRIAYWLLSLYSACLIGLFFKALFDESTGQPWLDLFKSGFLLLGGALTSVIGYYFGNQGVREAEENVRRLKDEVERKKEELGASAPTEEEGGLEEPPIE